MSTGSFTSPSSSSALAQSLPASTTTLMSISQTTRSADCRKFSPNIFNLSKCSHCFRQREEHSAAALECKRASRKISKCGYLFVAPDWDFSNPLYRSKRWQRRWFVLYDDGELSYSVDEHPETVPQACIDMTNVLEVSAGEDVTGHKNSIAITAPDRVTFVKGTCPEESKWWHNVLVSFPKSKGRHKRNATFPGGQPKTLLQSNSDTGTALTTRTRHNSYHKDGFTSSILISAAPSDGKPGRTRKTAWQRSIFTISNDGNKDDNDATTGCEDDVDITQMGIAVNAINGYDQDTQNAVNEITSRVSPPHLIIEDIRNDEKTIKDIANTITNLSQQQKCRWSTAAVNSVLNSHMHHASSGGDENTSRDEIDFHRAQKPTLPQLQPQQPTSQTTQLQPSVQATIVNVRPKTLTLTANTSIPTVPEPQANSGCPTSEGTNNTQHSNTNGRSIRCKSSPRLQLQLKHLQQKHHSNQHRQQKHIQQAHERGDPDGGCNLDDLSANYLSKTAELRITPASEEASNSKKGWLMKQDNCTGDWTKHWFILSGAALLYYRDPVSEERGVLDGVVDVNSLSSVGETTASRTYAFQLTTWDQHCVTLACLSHNSRNSWMAVLRSAAGLNSKQSNNNCSSIFSSATSTTAMLFPVSNPTVSKNVCTKADDIKSEIEKDFIKAQRNHRSIFQSFQESSKSNISQSKISKVDVTDASPIMIVTTNTTSAIPKPNCISPTSLLPPKSAHFSSDEEYRTASEGGRRDSVEGGSPLSPSSPNPLTLIRAKDRLWARSSNYQRLQKRSRSSPPSSRRSTVDSVASDELSVIHPVQEELSIDKELQLLLSVAEKERNILRDAAKDREARMVELLGTLERTEQQLTARVREMEEMRESLTTQLNDVKQNANDIVTKLSDELEENNKTIKGLEARLAQGIFENEILDKRLREMEGCSPSGFGNLHRTKFKRMDSLRDLTQITTIDPYCLDRDSLAEEYNELKSRFEKAVNEIRAMKRELKESQNQFDNLEISYSSLKQDFERRQNEDSAQLQMMAERIQDLTLKYSSSERQVRTLKQKLAKCERRRSLSLKGKEQLPISKDLEIKVATPQTSLDGIEHSVLENKPSQGCFEGQKQQKKSSRRRSLENSSNVDTQQFVVRVTDLEKRYEGVAYTVLPSTSSTNLNVAGTMIKNDFHNSLAPMGSKNLPDHLIERLRCLENVLITSKDRLEQSLQQLQNLRSSRTRRSVSPITDRKDSYRYVERCVADVVKLIRESCETCIISGTHSAPSVTLLPVTNPVKVALTQLEGQLRSKLGDLLKQRRVLRERNELTNRKSLELLAERIAFESVCFGRLRESVVRAEQPELLAERHTRAEVAETSHLMTMLKAKLSNKCTLKPSGSVDILAGVLARRLVLSTYRGDNAIKLPMDPVDKNILDDLLRQQNELNVIARRYKNNAMESLAIGLAAETISYVSSNDLVQGAVQEAWRQAQETVNAELVQSEIAHIMMRNAERFENAITPSFGYTLSDQERLSFEKFADAVYDALRKEMEAIVTQLTHCYQNAIEKMKRDQWRLHMEQERKASEDRHLLSEFADIVAHKALVDARISVLCGDFTGQSELCDTWESPGGHLGITALQKYEDLFEELSKDLQIDNPNDILAEADFQFMCNQYTGVFQNDRLVLSDISAFLSQLEDSLFALHFEATSAKSITRSDISIENMQDVCRKCSDLCHCAEQLLKEVHRKLNAPCQICLQVREKLCNLQHQHKSEILQVQQSNDHNMNVLMHELDSQRHELQNLEAAKRSFSEDLRRSEKLIEKREFEVDTINKMLRTKEEVLRLGQRDHLELLSQLDEQTEKLRLFQDESEALTIKCARQDEEYAVLLQERDCSQSALAKEKERSHRFEKRIELLELEHGKQLECLQEAYRDQLLSHCSDFSNATNEESFRQRYQTEIEQLRTLCEKGLAAMESSHRRIVGDLEEKHKQEIERLLVEKETALAEETQATLAALDAMRKAHQSEVQREIARFKKEFLKQFQRGESVPDTKEEELDELRQEILSFSEKYSIKCVENAALEEKLRSTNQKLKNVQQMQQIELRNKQFRAHLSSDNPATDSNFVQGLNTSKEDAACRDSEV